MFIPIISREKSKNPQERESSYIKGRKDLCGLMYHNSLHLVQDMYKEL